MKIELEQAVTQVEAMLAELRDLDGTELDDNARGRAAREHRTALSMRLQLLAHQADVVRVTLTGVHLSLRDQGRMDSSASPEG